MSMFSKPKSVEPATINDKKVQEAALLKEKNRGKSGSMADIMTSPIGITSPAPTAAKNLLGA